MLRIHTLIFMLLTMPAIMHGMSGLQSKTFLSPRSQSVNAARELVGWYRFINLSGKPWYGAVTATPSYGHSFRPERISQYLFGGDELIIVGSQVSDRQPNQLLADYFGLSPDFISTVSVRPEITTFLVDFDVYLGVENFYIRAHAPIVRTKYSLELQETIAETGSTTPFPPLYMDVPAVNAPGQSWIQAVGTSLTYGQVVRGIEQGRIQCSNTASALSEVQIAVGWNFINCPHRHLGFNLRGSIPTGTRPNGHQLFQAIVGNGHHTELGFGFTGHFLLWEKECEHFMSLYTDVNLTHLFGTSQCRSFDLCHNGFLSRYMLAKEFDAAGNYTNRTLPLINVTTLPVHVSAAIQLDLVVMFGYLVHEWSFDIGYGAWLRTHENISLSCQLPRNRYGLKGIQNVATFGQSSSATQSTATIFGNPFDDQALVTDINSPLFINTENIDIHSGQGPLSFTHKIFGHVSYDFDGCSGFDSFIGIGGEVEFEGLNPREDANFNHNSVSQWSVWIKGGLAF